MAFNLVAMYYLVAMYFLDTMGRRRMLAIGATGAMLCLIAISTGYSEKITEQSVAHLGARGLINKPIVKSKLAEVIRRVLDGG